MEQYRFQETETDITVDTITKTSFEIDEEQEIPIMQTGFETEENGLFPMQEAQEINGIGLTPMQDAYQTNETVANQMQEIYQPESTTAEVGCRVEQTSYSPMIGIPNNTFAYDHGNKAHPGHTHYDPFSTMPVYVGQSPSQFVDKHGRHHDFTNHDLKQQSVINPTDKIHFTGAETTIEHPSGQTFHRAQLQNISQQHNNQFLFADPQNSFQIQSLGTMDTPQCNENQCSKTPSQMSYQMQPQQQQSLSCMQREIPNQQNLEFRYAPEYQYLNAGNTNMSMDQHQYMPKNQTQNVMPRNQPQENMAWNQPTPVHLGIRNRSRGTITKNLSPGSWGVLIDFDSGEILDTPTNYFDLQKGWKVIKLNGQPFNKPFLMQLMNGSSQYTATFDTSPKKGLFPCMMR